jgi:predicted enzyme related to lactoylglutathione lyase
MMKKPDQAPHPALSVYFFVDDIEETLRKATEAGGQVLAPKTPIPGIGSWALFLDPDKIPVSIFEPEKK